jgi:hypothetical protein
MALQAPIFPIDQPVMPEERQIGRRASIDALYERMSAAAHQWMIGPRRIGKTSVAKAALARLRAQAVVALDVDLSKLEISTAEALAGEIARQASAAGVGMPRERRRSLLGRARRHGAAGGQVGVALQELGVEEGVALEAVAALLAGADDGGPGLGAVLEALAVHARATEQRVVLLLDEVHLLTTLTGGEEDLSRWIREPDVPLVCVLTGSEESAVRELREPGRPLAAVGQELRLPDIGTEDWLHGLRRRFAEAGVAIGDAELLAILAASDGHPRRTMLVCAHVHASAVMQPDRVATPVIVELAVRDARKDRSWS